MILSPTYDAEIEAFNVEISFRFLKGRKDRGEHIHLYLDEEKWGVVKNSPVRLHRLDPGPHKVRLEVMTIDHVEVKRSAEVRFTIHPPTP